MGLERVTSNHVSNHGPSIRSDPLLLFRFFELEFLHSVVPKRWIIFDNISLLQAPNVPLDYFEECDLKIGYVNQEKAGIKHDSMKLSPGQLMFIHGMVIARKICLFDLPNDFRLFCGDLGNEVNDDVLSKAFSRFPSFNMARVVRDKRTGKTKGYGFVSFANIADLAAALKEMNGKYVGNRPIKLRKSNWKERTDIEAAERQKSYNHKKPKLSKKSVLHK